MAPADRRFRQTQRQVVLLGRMGASEKMASFLVDLLDRQNGTVVGLADQVARPQREHA